MPLPPSSRVLSLLAAYACGCEAVHAGQGGFGENGLVLTDVPGFAAAAGAHIEIDQAGRIVVSGVAGDNGALNLVLGVGEEMAVLRFLPDGSIDESFGVQGRAVTTFGGMSMRHVGGLRSML
jgi:hypothetical protein